MLERRDALRQHRGVGPRERRLRAKQFQRNAFGELGQHGGQHHRQGLEAGQRARADVLQRGLLRVFGRGQPLGQHPRLRRVERLVDAVGVGHDLADGAVVFAGLERGADRLGLFGVFGGQRGRVARIAQHAVKVLGDEAGGAAGDVDVLADQVAVHPRDEVLGIEVHVFDARIQLGGDVVAHPFGIHAEFQVAQRRNAGAAALGHLFAADGDEAVHVDGVRRLAAGELQHGGPEQRVEVHDVLADEVNLFGVAVGVEQGVEVHALDRAIRLERRQVAHRRVQPDVEILARRVGDFDAEVGGIAGNVPVAQLGLAVFATQPLARLRQHFGLQMLAAVPVRARGPLLQEFNAARVGQLEEEMVGRLQDGRGARQRRVRVDQVGGRVNRAADLAGVAVLVFGVALGAFALDVAVGQEHALDRIVELLDGARFDQVLGFQGAVDVLRQRNVFRRVGRVPVVKADVKAVQILGALGRVARNQRLRRDAFLFGLQHDRRAVRVVSAHKVHRVARHSHRTNPDIGLDVLHDVADVEGSVGVGQRSGDKEGARHGCRLRLRGKGIWRPF